VKFVTLSTGDSVSLPARTFGAADRAWPASASGEGTSRTPAARGLPAVVLGAHPTSTAILAALGRATFSWDIASDSLNWLDGTGVIFEPLSIPATTTGAEFA
jgi:hypothetical protein